MTSPVLTRTRPLKPGCGRRGYASEQQARDAASATDLVYGCPRCGRWHRRPAPRQRAQRPVSAPRRPRKPLSACGPDYARREDAERHKRVINGTAIALACQWPGVTGHGWHVVSIREIEADIGRRRARIKPVSDKRRAENAGRRKMIALLWPDGTPKCAVPWCHRLADDVHEPLTRGRGGSITDPANATVLCRRHHDYITFTPESELAPWVYGLGFLVHSWPAGRSAKGQS